MERLTNFLDELFKRYDVSDEDIAKCGEILAGLGKGDLVTEGDEANLPDMGDEDEHEDEEDELAFH